MNKSTKNQKIRKIAETAIMLALATILSELAVVKLPFGGSVTFFSQVPMIVISYRYGIKWGAFSGLVMGAIQMFFEPDSGLERVTVGVVGELQFEVLEARMKSEYNVEFIRRPLAWQYIRRIANEVDPKTLDLYETHLVEDVRGNKYLLFKSEWFIQRTLEHNEGKLELVEFGS